jgi:translation initiation factor 1A
MVRNNKGGKKGKNVGRKHIVGSIAQKSIRLPEEEGEIYAGVTKMLGNGRVEVKCLDNKNRQCVIRQKFRGRGKRDNTIDIATWVLVGIRDWETVKEGKMGNCDLLTVYTQNEVENYLKKSDIDWSVLSSIEDKNGNKMIEDDNGVIFVNDIENTVTEPSTPTTITMEDDDEIDFDDI